MSSSRSSSFPCNDLLGEESPNVCPAFCDEVIPDGEALITDEASTDEDTPPNLEYAGGLGSIYTTVDETFL
jgi:hypothetical protein